MSAWSVPKTSPSFTPRAVAAAGERGARSARAPPPPRFHVHEEGGAVRRPPRPKEIEARRGDDVLDRGLLPQEPLYALDHRLRALQRSRVGELERHREVAL